MPPWSVAMQWGAKGADSRSFSRHTGSPTRWCIPSPLRSLSARRREGLDAPKPLRMVRRSVQSARQGWQVVQVSSVETEEQRHLHRDLATLKQERSRTVTCLQGRLRRQAYR